MTSIPITFPGVAPTAQPPFDPTPQYVPEPPTFGPKPPSPFNPAPPTYVPEPPAPFNPAPKGYPQPAPPPFDPTPTYVPEPPTYVPEPPVVPSMGMPPMGQSPVSQIAQILAAIQNPSNGMPMVLGGMPGVASPTSAPVGRPQTPWEPPLGSPLGSPMGSPTSAPVGMPMVLGGMPLSPYNSDAFPVGGTPQPRQGAPMGLANLLRRFQRAGGRSQLDGLRSKYSGGY